MVGALVQEWASQRRCDDSYSLEDALDLTCSNLQLTRAKSTESNERKPRQYLSWPHRSLPLQHDEQTSTKGVPYYWATTKTRQDLLKISTFLTTRPFF